MLGGLKDWTISLVIQNNEFTSNAVWALFCIAFLESSFFPIPPDVPYIMMGILKPETALFLATVLTAGSVLGGGLGYAIGRFGGRPVVEWLIGNRILGKLFTHEKFEMVEGYYVKYDFWAVFIAALTPIPYKVFTIGGGLCRIHFWRFMIVSVLGRGLRFYAVGTFLYFFGNQAQFIVKYFDIFLIVMMILVVLGFVAMRYIKPRSAPAEPPAETEAQ
ncbi:MAG: YqaA family protein [bacterium]